MISRGVFVYRTDLREEVANIFVLKYLVIWGKKKTHHMLLLGTIHV